MNTEKPLQNTKSKILDLLLHKHALWIFYIVGAIAVVTVTIIPQPALYMRLFVLFAFSFLFLIIFFFAVHLSKKAFPYNYLVPSLFVLPAIIIELFTISGVFDPITFIMLIYRDMFLLVATFVVLLGIRIMVENKYYLFKIRKLLEIKTSRKITKLKSVVKGHGIGRTIEVTFEPEVTNEQFLQLSSFYIQPRILLDNNKKYIAYSLGSGSGALKDFYKELQIVVARDALDE